MRRRILSLAVAITMMMPGVASVVEAATGTWLSPAPEQAVSGGKVEVAVGYNTESSAKVTRLDLYVDGKIYARKHLIQPAVRGVCSLMWDTTNVAGGTHDLLVKIYVGDKMIATVSGTGTVSGRKGSFSGIDMEPPTIKFSNIKSGDVLKGKATVKLAAYDNSGEAPLVSLLVDNALKLLRNTPPYTYDLDTTAYSNGSHELKTYAYDSAGNKSDPAVVKVSFKNNSEKPVTASLSVDHHPGETMSNSSMEPAMDAVPAPLSSKREQSAARAGEPKIERNVSESHPVVMAKAAEPRTRAFSAEPSIKTTAVAPVGVKAAVAEPDIQVSFSDPTPEPAPVVKSRPAPKTANPRNMKVASASASLSSARIKSGSRTASAPVIEPVAPSVVDSPRSAGVRSVSASRLPEARESVRSHSVVSTSARAAEPKVESAPKTSEVREVVIMPKPDIHHTNFSDMAAVKSNLSAAQEIIDEPVASGTKNVAVEKSAPELKSTHSVRSASSKLKFDVPSSADPESASISHPKNIRVAMAPSIRNTGLRTSPSHGFACPPTPPKSVKAKLEKTTIPSSGKVKARDLFNKLGGVLFWEPSTHTVIAFVHNMKIEMKIGSNKIIVNGVAMHIESAPRVLRGRTIIDASLYHQALAFAQTLSHSAMLESQGQVVAANGQLTLF